MIKSILSLSTILLVTNISFATTTVSYKCTAIPGLNRAEIEGTATISDDNKTVEGFLAVSLKRQGDLYESIQISDVGFRGLVEKLDGLPDSDNQPVVLTGLLINQLNSSKLQFVKIGLGLDTVNANSFVRDADGVKYFANCISVLSSDN